MKDLIIKTFGLSEPDVLSIFPYGSYVYGTNSQLSDYDFIIVCKNDTVKNDFSLERDGMNVHVYEEDVFIKQLADHKVSALECYYLPEKWKHLTYNKKYPFKLDLKILRSSFSEKASHAWVKSKKKFEVEKDRNVYIAKKSLFHSLRIIDFGIQIAKYGKINDYTVANRYWIEIKDNPYEDWNTYKDNYQEVFNMKMTQFREVAPK